MIATASPRSTHTVQQLGADQVIDYTTIRLDDAIDSPVDVVLNLVALNQERPALWVR